MDIKQAITEAQVAFWTVIMKHHQDPGEITGLRQASMMAFNDACQRAVNEWLKLNKPNSAKQKKGRLLEIEPDAEPIEVSFWGCWSPSGDESESQYEWDDSRSIGIAYVLLIQMSERLSIPDIHPSVLRGDQIFSRWYLSHGQHGEGYAAAMIIVVDKIIDAGYSVYISDTRLEVYLTEDLRCGD